MAIDFMTLMQSTAHTAVIEHMALAGEVLSTQSGAAASDTARRWAGHVLVKLPNLTLAQYPSTDSVID